MKYNEDAKLIWESFLNKTDIELSQYKPYIEKDTDCYAVIIEPREHTDMLLSIRNTMYYLNENNYKSFINTLKDICKKEGINGGKLTVEPFSLGKVLMSVQKSALNCLIKPFVLPLKSVQKTISILFLLFWAFNKNGKRRIKVKNLVIANSISVFLRKVYI